jgi:CBS domain-containing protein
MERLMQKKVSEFMTGDVIAVKTGEPLKNVFKLMDKHGILGLPVIDDEETVVGIVTESDLIRHFTKLEKPLGINILGSIVFLNDIQDFNENLKDHCAEKVGDMMSKNPVTVMQNFTLSQCIDLMAEKKVSRLPVVDAIGKLKGIITRTDIVHQIARLKNI